MLASWSARLGNAKASPEGESQAGDGPDFARKLPGKPQGSDISARKPTLKQGVPPCRWIVSDATWDDETVTTLLRGNANREARARTARRGRLLQYLTMAWNSAECVVAVVAGLTAGSIALAGFGFDSAIELASSVAALWRLRRDADEEKLEAPGRFAAQTSPRNCPGSCDLG